MKKTIIIVLAIISGLFSVSCAKNEPVELQALPAPVLQVEGDAISWSPIDGAINYLPEINGQELGKLATTSIDLSEYAAGDYKVKVKALGDGKKYGDSPWSAQITHTITGTLASPVIALTGKIVSWTAVENASSYQYKVNSEEAKNTTATSIDLSDRTTGTYNVVVRAISNNPIFSNSAWSNEVSLEISGKLSTPELVNESSSFIRNLTGEKSRVYWAPVSNATEYIVKVDGIVVSYSVGDDIVEVDLSSYSGSHTLTVQAVNTEHPELYSASETATLEFKSKNFGEGTESSPYLINDADDWNEFASYVATTYGFTDKYVSLAADIDFGGKAITSVGASSTKSFNGRFNGGNHILSNGIIGDGSTSNKGLFVCLGGSVEGLQIKNITVNAPSGDVLGRCAVLAGGQCAGSIANCYAESCTINSSGTKTAYLGIILSQQEGGVIRNCKIKNCTISALHDNIAAITGFLNTGSIVNCSVENGSVSGRSNIGGIAGNNKDGRIVSCTVKGLQINATSTYSGGICGYGSNGCVVNCISDGNKITTSAACSAGILGWAQGSVCVLNNISLNCIIDNTRSVTTNNDAYISFIVGGDKDCTGKCMNNLVLSGNFKYASVNTRRLGIFTGTRGTSTFYNFNYYKASVSSEANLTDVGTPVYGIGNTTKSGAELGGSTSVSEGSGLAATLNANIDNETYELKALCPEILKWETGGDGWPHHAQQ